MPAQKGRGKPDRSPATALHARVIPGGSLQPLISGDFTHYQLFADAQPLDQLLVSRRIAAFQVLQEPATLANHN
jgi:hypothetical protein